MTGQVILEENMGKIYTIMTVTNRADQIRAEDGTITPEQIRSYNTVSSCSIIFCNPKDF